MSDAMLEVVKLLRKVAGEKVEGIADREKRLPPAELEVLSIWRGLSEIDKVLQPTALSVAELEAVQKALVWAAAIVEAAIPADPIFCDYTDCDVTVETKGAMCPFHAGEPGIAHFTGATFYRNLEEIPPGEVLEAPGTPIGKIGEFTITAKHPTRTPVGEPYEAPEGSGRWWQRFAEEAPLEIIGRAGDGYPPRTFYRDPHED